MATFCVECRHHLHVVANPSAPDVWYSHQCAAVSRAPATDPVTGRARFLESGRFTDDRHPNCRDINHGNCPHYVPTPILRREQH